MNLCTTFFKQRMSLEVDRAPDSICWEVLAGNNFINEDLPSAQAQICCFNIACQWQCVTTINKGTRQLENLTPQFYIELLTGRVCKNTENRLHVNQQLIFMGTDSWPVVRCHRNRMLTTSGGRPSEMVGLVRSFPWTAIIHSASLRNFRGRKIH